MISNIATETAGKCNGLEFYITDRWKFCVPELNRVFDSHEEMAGVLERLAKLAAEAKRRKVVIPAVTNKGERVTVTGIHAGTGATLTTPPIERDGRSLEIFVDTALVDKALRERRRVKHDLAVVEALLDRYRLDGFLVRGGHYRFDLTKHGDYIAKLEAVQATAVADAGLGLAAALKTTTAKRELIL